MVPLPFLDLKTIKTYQTPISHLDPGYVVFLPVSWKLNHGNIDPVSYIKTDFDRVINVVLEHYKNSLP